MQEKECKCGAEMDYALEGKYGELIWNCEKCGRILIDPLNEPGEVWLGMPETEEKVKAIAVDMWWHYSQAYNFPKEDEKGMIADTIKNIRAVLREVDDES